MEYIECTALKKDDIIISLPRPNRHGDVIRYIVDGGKFKDTDDFEQGFMTNHGRYVDRTHGSEIAIASGQITKLNWPPYLYSEDLW